MRLILVLLLFVNVSFSQQISGLVLDSEIFKPLVYANVFLNHQNYGVTTNEKGAFNLLIPKTHKSDSLIISYIGYKTQKIAINRISENQSLKIGLVKCILSLDEVVLNVSKHQFTGEKTLKVKRKRLIATSIPFGYEKITFIENEKKVRGLLTEVILHFKEKKAKNYLVLPAYYRVKFFSKKANRFYPNKLLCLDNIIIKPENKTQNLILDITKYKIPFPKEGFFIGLEAINPNLEKPKTSIYVIKPAILMSHSKESLSFSRFLGGEWNSNQRKSPFKKKPLYKNLFIGLKVKYLKG